MTETIEIKNFSGGNGFGMGFVDKKPVLVPGTVPGDVCSIEITGKGKFWTGRVIEFVKKSDKRTANVCPFYLSPDAPKREFCGGCPMMGVSMETELEAKLEMICRAFRQHKPSPVLPRMVEECGPQTKYRNRLRGVISGGKTFLRQGLSDRLAIVDFCPVCAVPEDLRLVTSLGCDGEFTIEWTHRNEIAIRTKEKITRIPETEDRIISLISGKKLIYGTEDIDIFDGKPFYKAPGEFAQAGLSANKAIIGAVMDFLNMVYHSGEILELYAGSGNITRYLEDVAVVHAVETSDVAKQFYKNVKRSKFYGKSASFFPDIEGISVVVSDPPREGMDKVVTEKLISLAPGAIILISCDPMTGARDISRLIQGGYEHRAIRAINTMPMTAHFEMISLLTR
ncbi:hypothetical protein KKF34_17250 [Myxococcota bacterium]|nr:hypothetical protein [Myxococcota bacterium]MBU1381089.1 hypothetical protein [Myxococcota bacterium]MBU1498628.1 hypothetical protein [Myxococcota bacterium]